MSFSAARRFARAVLAPAVATALALPLAAIVAAPAQAAPSTGLVISEVFGANSATNLYNQDFVEIHNLSSAPIDLGGKSVQYRSATGAASPSGVFALSGSIPAGGYYLVGLASTAGGKAIPTPDATSNINLSGSTGTVILANKSSALTAAELPVGDAATNGATNVIDLLGYGTSNTFEGSVLGTAPTTASTAVRTNANSDTDNNNADFSASLVGDPQNSSGNPPTTLSVTNPGDRTAAVGQPVSIALQAAGGTTPYAWTATGLPAGLSISAAGVISGTPTAAGAATVNATVTDNAGASSSTTFTLTVNAQIPVKTIAEIQGDNAADSPLKDKDVATEGVVTARYPDGGMNGFVIQTPGYDPAADPNPDASNAVFVYQGPSPSYAPPAIGDFVTISSGKVVEFFGLTELTVTSAANLTSRAATAAEAVKPGTVVPGTDCTVTGSTSDCLAGPALAAVREKHESEVFLPTAPITVSDSYDGSPWAGSPSSNFGEIGLAVNDTKPLVVPVEVANPTSQAAEWTARDNYNKAKAITLDDGATISITSSGASTNTPYPWLTKTHTVRVGASVTFVKPAVFEYRNTTWKLIPQTRVQPGDTGEGRVQIAQNRPAQPEAVPGNVKIATFNMLNYFVHPAQDWVNPGPNGPGDTPGSNRTCTYYRDRAGALITANTCTWTDPRNNPPSTLPDIGPRGAATAASLDRQEKKEVAAINRMAADVMSLEEVENPVKIGYADRDAALKRLVRALNEDWEASHSADPSATPRWAYVASPRPAAQPTILEQDAIRSAFIYNPRVVAPVGASQILVNSAAFRNAREPLAQAFKHVAGNRDDGFIVIVNHFKSKGAPQDPATVAGTDNADAGKGAGFYNGDRVRQAKALDAFAKDVAADKGIPAVFMTGDYNAYSAEDPIRLLEQGGWTNVSPANGEASYSFAGLAGSLDHVLANQAAMATMAPKATVWPINANEPVYYEYSRFNYNVTDLHDAGPFRSSDHNPEIVGITAPLSPPNQSVDTVQVLASNDFHGRILDDPGSTAAGAESMAQAVHDLRAQNPSTIFAMAGDIIGASTFESFIQKDKPTLDAMNAAGLDVSAAGNHEFDGGYRDLMDRVMATSGAKWPYIAANVRTKNADGSTGGYALKTNRTDGNYANSNGASWWRELPATNGSTSKRVGFVGAVTEDLPSLVAPSAIADVKITSIVTEVNTEVSRMKTSPSACGTAPCDLVVVLVHEGSASPDCSTIATQQNKFGAIVRGINADADAIISGHTHLKYNCRVAVPEWSNRAVKERPVVSAGQYGSYLNQLEFEFAAGTKNLTRIRQHVLAIKDYQPTADVAAVTQVVNQATAHAATEGAKPLGLVADKFWRARRNDPLTNTPVENRGGESTLGNLVAEMQRAKTGADIGVMNPGGLREDLDKDDNATVTYREAADVQPFANSLMTTTLTGAQLKTLLEQQWQRDPEGNVPSRPFLRLGTSKGFTFTEDASRPEGDRITGMWLNGTRVPPDASRSYKVSANSFLMAGGDNFRALTQGAGTQDTGFTDLQATIGYLEERAPVTGTVKLPVDLAQHGVGATLPAQEYAAGQSVTIDLSSLSMTGAEDPAETQVRISLRGVPLGTFPVTTALSNEPYDTAGKATATFTMPANVPGGIAWLDLEGLTTGTKAKIPVRAVEGRATSTVTAAAVSLKYGAVGHVVGNVSPAGATGTATLSENGTTVGSAAVGAGGAVDITLAAKSLSVGTHTLTLSYSGDDTTQASTSTVTVTVTKADSVVSAVAAPAVVTKDSGTTTINVTVQSAATPSGAVEVWDGSVKLGTSSLDASGKASVTVGPFTTLGTKSLRVVYLGNASASAGETTVPVTVQAGTPPTPTPTPTPGNVSVDVTAPATTYGKASTVTVAVTPAITGQVALHDGAAQLGTAAINGSSVTFSLSGTALKAGKHTLKAVVTDASGAERGTGTVEVIVAKAKPTVQVKAAKANGGRSLKVAATVKASGYTPGGAVKIVARSQGAKGKVKKVVTLKSGQAAALLKLPRAGKWKLAVIYLGDANTERAKTTKQLKRK